MKKALLFSWIAGVVCWVGISSQGLAQTSLDPKIDQFGVKPEYVQAHPLEFELMRLLRAKAGVEEFRVVLDKGGDPNLMLMLAYGERSAIQTAAWFNRVDVAALMLDFGGKVDNEFLSKAFGNKSVAMIEMLIARGFVPSEDQYKFMFGSDLNNHRFLMYRALQCNTYQFPEAGKHVAF